MENSKGESSRSSKKRSGETLYSYIKCPARGTKIIRLEIRDIDDNYFQNNEKTMSFSDVNICTQYVVENTMLDDIYKNVKDIINKISKKIERSNK